MKFQAISNVEIAVKEYRGQRVVTFKDIDAVHGRPEGSDSMITGSTSLRTRTISRLSA